MMPFTSSGFLKIGIDRIVCKLDLIDKKYVDRTAPDIDATWKYSRSST